MNADQVLDYLIIPTLTRCGFSKENIVRSDKIAKPGRISEHIASCIETSELCIIDLTGLNANVMYEYGLRKGYGKPYIVLAQKGQLCLLMCMMTGRYFMTFRGARADSCTGNVGEIYRGD